MGRALLVVLIVGVLVSCSGNNVSDDVPLSGVRVSTVLSGASEGFAKAQQVRPFKFPDDHGAHPRFRSDASVGSFLFCLFWHVPVLIV